MGEFSRERVEASLRSMLDTQAHRGPDDEGMTLLRAGDSTMALAHTRLAILDLSSAGHQPMKDPGTGNWIVYNGEIYNYRELRETLGVKRERLGVANESWQSRTDTEVILRAYAKWGRDCINRLRGMFAFALWDAGRQELFLARDRLGIKPLYTFAAGGLFIFASEIRSLLASGLIPRRLDPLSLWHYLAYQSVPAPRTLIDNVRMLLPGHSLTVDTQGTVREERYWDLLESASRDAQGATADQAARQVRELLGEAVELHLVSDVPLGIFLSGGIDSSALVALTREMGHEPKTFSVIFPEEKYNEAPYSRKIAGLFQTDHNEILLSEDDLFDRLPDALAAMDHPTGDGINSYVVARAVKNAGLKVALSGLGGDEFFAGYPSFERLARVEGFQRFWGYAPDAVKTVAGSAVRALGGSVAAEKIAALLEGDGTLAGTYPLMRQVLSPAQRLDLLEDSWCQGSSDSPNPYAVLLREALAREDGAGLMSRISYAEARAYMHDVLLRDTDQMSMAHGLEVRVPLLDHKLVEYLMGLPDEQKPLGRPPKRLLVESLRGLLPDEIVCRPKQGFTLPLDSWMRGALRGFCEERLGPDRLGGRGIFRPQALAKFWQAFQSRRRDTSWSRLWILVVLEEWLERNNVKA